MTRCKSLFRLKTIQNDLILYCANHVRETILKDVIKAKYFLILADEVADGVSNSEQLSLVLRFVDHNCTIREQFVVFFHV